MTRDLQDVFETATGTIRAPEADLSYVVARGRRRKRLHGALFGIASLFIAVAVVSGGLTFIQGQEAKPLEPAAPPHVPQFITVPAAQGTETCPAILRRSTHLGPEHLSDVLSGHYPTWLPDGAGFAFAWKESTFEQSRGARWITQDCRIIEVILTSDQWDSTSWTTETNDPNCETEALGDTNCVRVYVGVDEGTLGVETVGIPEDQAQRIAVSIPL